MDDTNIKTLDDILTEPDKSQTANNNESKPKGKPGPKPKPKTEEPIKKVESKSEKVNNVIVTPKEVTISTQSKISFESCKHITARIILYVSPSMGRIIARTSGVFHYAGEHTDNMIKVNKVIKGKGLVTGWIHISDYK